MVRYRQLSFVAGVLALAAYAAFALAAYSRYPGLYSPLRNWLSDLGSTDLNPQGATFYALAVISAGVVLIPFFLGLSRWRLPAVRVQPALLLASQIFGILGSVALILSAVFPINHPEQHRVWSILLYVLLGTAFAFSVSALRYHPSCPRWVLVVGLVTAAVDILSGVFGATTWLEWATVALFLGYVVLVGIQTRRLPATRA